MLGPHRGQAPYSLSVGALDPSHARQRSFKRSLIWVGEDDQSPELRRRHQRHGPSGQAKRPFAPGPEAVHRAHPRDVHPGDPPGLRAQIYGPLKPGKRRRPEGALSLPLSRTSARATCYPPWARLLKESVMSWRTAMVTAVAATAVHVGLRMRFKMVAPTKNSRPRAAWSVICRATRPLPSAPRATRVARTIPAKMIKLPTTSETIRRVFTAA